MTQIAFSCAFLSYSNVLLLVVIFADFNITLTRFGPFLLSANSPRMAVDIKGSHVDPGEDGSTIIDFDVRLDIKQLIDPNWKILFCQSKLGQLITLTNYLERKIEWDSQELQRAIYTTPAYPAGTIDISYPRRHYKVFANSSSIWKKLSQDCCVRACCEVT